MRHWIVNGPTIFDNADNYEGNLPSLSRDDVYMLYTNKCSAQPLVSDGRTSVRVRRAGTLLSRP